MAVYLETHPPKRSQYRVNRREPVTGQIVLHTAENQIDLSGPDGGAEAVARFIANRSDPGSYHGIVDSDSAVQLGRWQWAMFHVGVRHVNDRTLGLAFACRTTDWGGMAEDRRDAFLRQGVEVAWSMADWVKGQTGIIIPAVQLTAHQFWARRPGFISHANLDPSRRSDPGRLFPWAEFLTLYAAGRDSTAEHVIELQRYLVEQGIDIGSSGPAGDGVDGDFGPKTAAGWRELEMHHHARIAALGGAR